MIIPPELLSDLYHLREEHRKGPIARQIPEAIKAYVLGKKERIAAANGKSR